MSRADVTHSPVWKKLTDHQKAVAQLHLRELFETDPKRGTDLTVTAGDLYVDYSKHRATRETLGLLLDLARTAGVEELRDAMFSGAHINVSEDRAVLHTALRERRDGTLMVDGRNVTMTSTMCWTGWVRSPTGSAPGTGAVPPARPSERW